MIRRVIGQLGFVLFTLLVTSVLVEIGARFLFPEWALAHGGREFWIYDADLGWRHKPDAEGRFSFVDFDVHVRMNAHGMRDDEVNLARTPGQGRMLVLSDSFGWGFGVERGEIFADVIDERHPDWEIVNASVNGYGTDQEYLYYLLHGHRYRPDLVLLFVAGNDVANSSSPVQYWHNKPFFALRGDSLELTHVPVPEMSPRQKLANFLTRYTYVPRIVWHRVSALRREQALAEGAAPPPARFRDASGAAAPALPPGDERVLRLALMLDQATRQHGARLVVVTLPGEHPAFDDERFTRAGIPHLSLTGVFHGATEPTTFEHDAHWTPAGHAMVADAIDAFLKSEGLYELDGGEAGVHRAVGPPSSLASRTPASVPR